MVGALGAGTEPVALPSSIEISSVFIFRSSAPSFLVYFGCPPCTSLDCTCTCFSGMWGFGVNPVSLVFGVVILEDLGIIPGASVGSREVLAAA